MLAKLSAQRKKDSKVVLYVLAYLKKKNGEE
jgi:hypothetical protein